VEAFTRVSLHSDYISRPRLEILITAKTAKGTKGELKVILLGGADNVKETKMNTVHTLNDTGTFSFSSGLVC